MHPSQLSDLLRDKAGAEQFKPEALHEYASLVLRVSTMKGKQHSRAGTGSIPEASISLPYQCLRKRFGANGFRKINEYFRCIDHTPNWSVNDSTTRAFWLTEEGWKMIEEARRNALEGQKNTLLNADGTRMRRRKNGIYTARDIDGRNAITNGAVNFVVPINLPAIEYVLDVGVGLAFPDCTPARQERIDGAIRAIHACALNDNLGHGYLPQEYHEAESGRLYGRSDLSLQNVPKEAKRTALYGMHEYDFANCHYQILAWAAVELGLVAPVIRKYIENPKLFRRSLADRVGITVKQAKTCMLAVMYGATQSLWQGCAIPKAIGADKACLLYADSDFDALCLEVTEIGDEMRNHARRLSSGAIVNCRGKACIGNEKRELSHLLAGMESELLHVVIEQYGEHILLLQHDGFVLSKCIHPGEIEAEISYQTGIDMPVTYEQLSLIKKA